MQIPDLTLLLYSALVVAALATALTHSRPMRWWRKWMSHYTPRLACCPWCIGFWISLWHAIFIMPGTARDVLGQTLSLWALASVFMAPIVGMGILLEWWQYHGPVTLTIDKDVAKKIREQMFKHTPQAQKE